MLPVLGNLKNKCVLDVQKRRKINEKITGLKSEFSQSRDECEFVKYGITWKNMLYSLLNVQNQHQND